MSNINSFSPIPADFSAAVHALRSLLSKRRTLPDVNHAEFMAGWAAIAFIAPGLHPDESGNEEGGWPEGWRCIANEAFRRAEAGEMADEELYPYAAAQRALCVA